MVQLELKNVCKKYSGQSHYALDHINLVVEKGDFVAIMGRSGSGKTTFLNVSSTIDSIDSGDIFCGDKNIGQLSDKEATEFRKNNVGFVFQDYMLLDSLTIRENIAIALSLQNVDKSKIDDKINDYASELNLYEQLEKYPYQLSGGQKQRASIIRAIIKNPEIVFADEPTGALDLKSSEDTMKLLSKINRMFNVTILMVTHDILSASYANRVVVLKDGQFDKEILKSGCGSTYRDTISQALSKVGE
ncbi:ABC transporter ATP-binding protein [Streptococcus gallolyticus]|uniref:Methionine ABC transporter ATP-binding protein n=1 Tax=Streptococcus gallolyticus TaxID=315405 RepID=A0A139QN00_9STRE|nr:ABC transporter ATP-binding protein [Streptococcus gallolyticus]AQP41721.1 putative ABC transport system permeasecomponent [Streptococcus gallolyticus subsp. gallolyticus DSM 16831]KXU03741.1 Methionine ABC transporter ATP-binding protein [Streptococcus gallolyticus]MCQ9215876.1 ABC transporter ATP-binding protein [Streptococcus gallolyticus]MCY7166123.1 ABC transporter ATP-binding protein [Streptococcus gallolyticus subsp. gallolyticus]MCY7183221.1 ABC transporter ATP-binding protein [Stre